MTVLRECANKLMDIHRLTCNGLAEEIKDLADELDVLAADYERKHSDALASLYATYKRSLNAKKERITKLEAALEKSWDDSLLKKAEARILVLEALLADYRKAFDEVKVT
jgi:hypothetical protein